MGRALFVAWLFISALACLVIAGTRFSLGWLLGGIVLFPVAVSALRQFKKEQETGRATPSGGFVAKAILIMIAAMLFLFWLQSSA